ncbi:hypothetical protein [Providencia phage PSTRCR_117lys]|nr:hypothetical protein [Providencia phage PSTRCR_117lys]
MQITFHIGTTVRFRCDVVDGLCFGCPAFTQTLLAQVFISAQDCGAQPVPLGTVSAFMPALALLVVLPPCIAVLFAVSAAVGSCLRTASFAAGAGNAWWHHILRLQSPLIMNRLYDWFMPSLRLSRHAAPAVDVAARIGNHTVDSLFLILSVHSLHEINRS